ncbi:nucleotidyltransferase [Geodermatophilus sp. DSM 44513]|uniref:nucleotidyltransferase n=1 Tax=Geodermatophilus sp. DSM 44513 TaxID=1528104 RepID=UPI001282B495|nr:nucleotidyltransferase [Geodermatophilus sp. DSM 44513]WNV74446.1 hypothetical protein RTG05_15825 [Geodermatophilus sp. DSM 44513]
MKVNTAFDIYQTTVNAPPAQVAEAKARRDLFKDAFGTEGDIKLVRASGSLARGTQHDPIKDVDTILIYKPETKPEWGQPGDSAEDALDYVRDRVRGLLGTYGSYKPNQVRLARPGDHAVKCFLDDPDAESPFTVDAMPALRQPDGSLLVPEIHSHGWIRTNPGYLIDLALDAHAQGRIYAPLVRVLKRWRRRTGTHVKSLLIEVLALECLPKTGERSAALAAFFAAAAVRVNDPICDPAGLCGPIQPDLDVVALRTALEEAADIAANARQHERWDQHDVAVRLWGDIFGPDFPKPPNGGGSGGGPEGGPGGVPIDIPKRPVRDINQG